ncbi:UDP-3-O-(3-hydroxymyristoyl)glucosamine N-acyltransferase [Imhoffiella purpurea]|uniref:UDP-3-O-acylglucosamine N-acyltransferase n=1 Tax=Imhoffiella purpurea TaxID=1249627 RepID=W9VBW9_9GAMM|nr:UDP-3-O-(3-hydroxymyristoyl)glucosamine N-acyltransferase [Imhoffiella purpurea]EXJ14466.1 UDP-3-O-[3-hydroxymyristoyl] glucosamine N-acyltransferase [Imhoffiella purpurea]
MTVDLSEICTRLGINPIAPPQLTIGGVNTLELARETDLSFAERSDQAIAVGASHASAVLVPPDFPELPGPILLRVSSPRTGFFAIAELFVSTPEGCGIHPSALIDPQAELGKDVAVGACAVVASGARVGARSILGAGVYLGPEATLGTDCLIEANVTIHRDSMLGDRTIVHSGSVIGSDGFGYVWDGGAHRKVPQLGRVRIESDVEIGCNCCVDRATLGETRIRRGTKIDNLVQIAHNTDIGEHVILVAQSGIAGSSRVGTGAVIAGQVAISDHVSVGNGARIGGQSGVTKDIPAGAEVFGTPARPLADTLRELAALARLPALLKRIRQQERQIEDLTRRLAALEQRAGRRDSPQSAPVIRSGDWVTVTAAPRYLRKRR